MANDLDAARATAFEALRAKLSQSGSGDLIATSDAGQAIHASGGRTPRLPVPRPSPDEPRSTASLPAPKDPVSQRLALAFAATADSVIAAQPPTELPEPATPAGAAFALAYADADSAGEVRATSAGNAIEALVHKHAKAHKVPPALAHALVQVESSFRPKATGRNGEIGLMQITPKTARAIGYKGSAKALYDPETNLTWGMRYLAKAQRLAGGDLCGTLLRYNAGLDAKRKSAASSKFCAKVKSVMAKQA